MAFICNNLIDFQYLVLLVLTIFLTHIRFHFYSDCNASIYRLVLH